MHVASWTGAACLASTRVDAHETTRVSDLALFGILFQSLSAVVPVMTGDSGTRRVLVADIQKQTQYDQTVA